MAERWKKIVAQKAIDAIGEDQLNDEAAELLTPDISPEQLVNDLAEQGQWVDAVRALAQFLPRREAAWWACLCAREMPFVVENESELKALKAAEKWVYEPTTENRLAAFAAAQEGKENSAGLLCALMVAMVEEKLDFGEGQVVEFDPTIFPQGVFGIVAQAADDGDEDQLYPRLEKFLGAGIKIAQGGSGKPGKESEMEPA